jgi:hypothetical protein
MAAFAFSKQSQFAGRSKMKHMDCRQQWLDVLQDISLIRCVHWHVSTEYNLADLLTNLKSLDVPRFVHQLATYTARCHDGPAGIMMVPALTLAPSSELGQDIDWSSGQGLGGEEQGSQGRVLAERTNTLVFAVKAARLGVCGDSELTRSTHWRVPSPVRVTAELRLTASASARRLGVGGSGSGRGRLGLDRAGSPAGPAWVPRTGAPPMLP